MEFASLETGRAENYVDLGRNIERNGTTRNNKRPCRMQTKCRRPVMRCVLKEMCREVREPSRRRRHGRTARDTSGSVSVARGAAARKPCWRPRGGRLGLRGAIHRRALLIIKSLFALRLFWGGFESARIVLI